MLVSIPGTLVTMPELARTPTPVTMPVTGEDTNTGDDADTSDDVSTGDTGDNAETGEDTSASVGANTGGDTSIETHTSDNASKR